MTKKQYEQRLNRKHMENYTLDQTVEAYEYIAYRKGKKSQRLYDSLILHAYNNIIGTFIRKHDPTLFNVSYNEMNIKS